MARRFVAVATFSGQTVENAGVTEAKSRRMAQWCHHHAGSLMAAAVWPSISLPRESRAEARSTRYSSSQSVPVAGELLRGRWHGGAARQSMIQMIQ